MKQKYEIPESELIQLQAEGNFLSSGDAEDLLLLESLDLSEMEFWTL